MSEDNQVEIEESRDEVIELQQVPAHEAKAREKGWVGLEEWEEQGKDPDDWVTARHFNERGEWYNKFNAQKNEMDERLKNNNTLWKATLEAREKELMDKRKEFIELSDVDGVEKVDKELKDIDKQKAQTEVTVSQSDISIETEWIKQNSDWLKKGGSKAIYANYMNEMIQQQYGYRGQQLVDALNEAIEKEYPTTNANREKPSVTDKSSPSHNGKSKKVSSISDLTGQDKAIAMSLKNQGMSDKKIIQMINDREI